MSGNTFDVVLDTNVVFEGLTSRGGACDLIIQAWLARRINVFVSTALATEYATEFIVALATQLR